MLDRAAPINPDLAVSAPSLAAAHQAALVFWIEDGDPCQIHFFVPDAAGGQFSSRIIDIDLSNQSSRYDAIAVVAAIMIEGLILSRTSAQVPTSEPKPPPPAPEAEETPGRRFEIHLAYSGTLAAPAMPIHGGTLGAGLCPHRWIFAAVSLSLYAPATFSNEALRIRLVSRQIDVHAAARLLIRPLEIRLGVSYSVDLRSYSTTAVDETIRSRRDNYNGIHSFVPFLYAGWTYRERIGIFGRMGASLAINETVFRIRRADGNPTEELEPFDVKLIYQLGALVRF